MTCRAAAPPPELIEAWRAQALAAIRAENDATDTQRALAWRFLKMWGLAKKETIA